MSALGLHPITIRRWMKIGKIQAVRVAIQARIPRSEIERSLGKTDERLLVLYACVSGHDQRPDLLRQMQRLESRAKAERPTGEVLMLSDSGSGFALQKKKTIVARQKA